MNEAKMRALVLDDEFAGRQRMVSLLAERSDVEVKAICESVDQARRALAGEQIDVAFLDVRLPEGTGFDAVADLPRERRPVVVLATAYEEHAVAAFDEAATDYLLKPISDERLDEALRRAREVLGTRAALNAQNLVSRLEGLVDKATAPHGAIHGGPTPGHATEAPARDERVAVRSAGRVSFVRHQEIDWLDAAGNSVRIHAAGQTYRVHETIAHFEKVLDSRAFARIHRSTIVRLDRVAEILVNSHGAYVALLEGGQRLTVGRSYRARIRELISRK
jgi:two-component system, LytTR family, response regulator